MKVLDDVRVLDLTHFYNGPYATLVLGFFGAEVIKIEPPELGERARPSPSDFPHPRSHKRELSIRNAEFQ